MNLSSNRISKDTNQFQSYLAQCQIESPIFDFEHEIEQLKKDIRQKDKEMESQKLIYEQ